MIPSLPTITATFTFLILLILLPVSHARPIPRHPTIAKRTPPIDCLEIECTTRTKVDEPLLATRSLPIPPTNTISQLSTPEPLPTVIARTAEAEPVPKPEPLPLPKPEAEAAPFPKPEAEAAPVPSANPNPNPKADITSLNGDGRTYQGGGSNPICGAGNIAGCEDEKRKRAELLLKKKRAELLLRKKRGELLLRDGDDDDGHTHLRDEEDGYNLGAGNEDDETERSDEKFDDRTEEESEDGDEDERLRYEEQPPE